MKHITDLSAIPTTVHHYPSSLKEEDAGNSPLLIFIPGNPGVIEYYKEYFESLQKNWPSLEILGISQAGHDIPTSSTNLEQFQKVFTLEDQIEHKVQIIENFLNSKHDRKLNTDLSNDNQQLVHAGTIKGRHVQDVFIMGHSVGSYMMERIVVRLLDKVNFKFIGFLTPTIIDIHKSDKGNKLFPIVKLIPSFNSLVSTFSHILKWIPERIRGFLLGQILNNPPKHAFNATSGFISKPQQIKQSLGLATEEMYVIQDDWEYFLNFSKSTRTIPKWFYFSNVDHWVNNETQKQITEKLLDESNVKVENSDHIIHSFCIQQSEEFADITINALKELYK
ncbi:hypothetical protein BN7_1111 [Wickerhamomyces ciferrii]|uniref:Lipid droplet-associated hydrolase n=1 Tax=Wickerhamomyces ciferrii (strain ATCC 14091 / BCRC 22168 / CBS 111 / JCM 3599 / NBRC 0793 / NRRL Y-1031 F-60-10) TaxID=1206466 RepID=K0K9H9_WICCF|nr:uncharacterized protein BN7_1111 [Wickerhamomyces ciferrii]CCH41570.1 hypothetical protein BN7_1111 [Wickerhamomyces ciferrii]